MPEDPPKTDEPIKHDNVVPETKDELVGNPSAVGTNRENKRVGPLATGTTAAKPLVDPSASRIQSDSPGDPPASPDSAGERERVRAHELLRIGTRGAVVLVFMCLVGAGVLCSKLVWSSLSSAQDELMVRVLLSCVACFIGMGFACLGFGLFLIQAQGQFSADVVDGSGPPESAEAKRWGRLATNAPGLVVVVCATIVIALALNLSWKRTTTTSTPVGPTATALDPAKDGVVMPDVPKPDVPKPPHPSDDGIVMPTVPKDAQLKTPADSN